MLPDFLEKNNRTILFFNEKGWERGRVDPITPTGNQTIEQLAIIKSTRASKKKEEGGSQAGTRDARKLKKKERKKKRRASDCSFSIESFQFYTSFPTRPIICTSRAWRQKRGGGRGSVNFKEPIGQDTIEDEDTLMGGSKEGVVSQGCYLFAGMIL